MAASPSAIRQQYRAVRKEGKYGVHHADRSGILGPNNRREMACKRHELDLFELS